MYGRKRGDLFVPKSAIEPPENSGKVNICVGRRQCDKFLPENSAGNVRIVQLNVAAILPYWVYVIFAYCETVFRVVFGFFWFGHSEVLAQNGMGTKTTP